MTRASQASSPIAAYLLGESHAVSRFHEKLVRDVKPDVIHLHNISLLGLGVQRVPRNRPVLYTAHDYWFRCPRSDLMKRGRTPCETPTCLSCMIVSHRVPPPWRAANVASRMGRVGCVIAPSRFMAGLAASSFACPVAHIPNFVPDENPGGQVTPASPYFLYAGVLETHKGLRVLAEAAREYRGTKRFVLVGRGTEETTLRDLAGQPGSKLEVRPWADRTTLSALYKEAAAFLMPSTCLENAPLAAIEALSWGAPLLTTSRGGVPELLHGGMAGTAFDPDAASLASALQTFDSLPDPLTLRRAARNAYETYHRPAVYLRRYLEVVEALASGNALALAKPAGGGNAPAVGALSQEA